MAAEKSGHFNRLTGYLIILAVCLVFPACMPDPSVAGLPEQVIPDAFGVNIHFKGATKNLDLIAGAGFRYIRRDMTWSVVERQKGVYNFTGMGYDTLTYGALERGIGLLYIIDYSNPLFEKAWSVVTPEGRRAFADFAFASASRYAGHNIIWEIWNEPNIKTFWRPKPDVEAYMKLVEAAAPRLREADSTGIIAAPALASMRFDWLEECFQLGLLKWIDVLTVHPYRDAAPETVIDDYTRLRKMIKKYSPGGKEIPIISGEWGYSLITFGSKRLTEERQAQYLVRMFLVNLWQGIPLSIWYDWRNDGEKTDNREHNFGTMKRNLEPKAAFRAMKVLNNTLNGYRIDKRIETNRSGDFILQLKKGDRRALALWTTGEPHRVSLKYKSGRGSLVDMFGNLKPFDWHHGVLELRLSPSPSYLVID